MMDEKDLQKLETNQPGTSSTADQLENELEKDIPEKFRGKDKREIAKAYEDLEKEKSRLANELGEFRKLTDTLLGLEQARRTSKPESNEVKPVTTEELLDDTPAALNKAVEQNPVVQRAISAAEKLERELAVKQFEEDFPDYKKDLQDPNFGEWVNKSRARRVLAAAADNYDIESARALWELWNEYKELTNSATEEARRKAEADARRSKAEKDAELEGAATADAGATEMVYDRKKLMELRIKALRGDRAAQEQLRKLGPKLQKAYDERRVR